MEGILTVILMVIFIIILGIAGTIWVQNHFQEVNTKEQVGIAALQIVKILNQFSQENKEAVLEIVNKLLEVRDEE